MATVPLDYQTYSSILDQADALVRKTGKGLTRVDALHALATTSPHDPRYAAAARACGRQTAPARAVVTKVAPARPLRKAEEAATPVYEEIRLQGDALFRVGLAGSVWEGMGQYASQHPDVFQAYVEECRRVNGQPDPRVTKAMAALTPPRSATDTLMQAITTRQAEVPGRSFLEAANAVVKAAPELHTAYVMEQRYQPQSRPRPVGKAEPLTYEQILKTVDAQVAQQPSLSRREVLMDLVQKHPHEQAYLAAYRQYHLTTGLEEYHGAEVAKRQAYRP